MGGKAEGEFVKFAHEAGWWVHKFMDVRYCPNCHKPIFMTKHTQEADDYSTSIVDYLVGIPPMHHGEEVYTMGWVEVKGAPNRARLPFKEFDDKQIRFLSDFTQKGVLTLLFISLGEGRAPNRRAWLVPWWQFERIMGLAKGRDMKSLPWKTSNRKADVFSMDNMSSYELEWITREGWRFTDRHPLRPRIEYDYLED